MSRPHISPADAGLTARNVTRRDALRFFIGAGVCATMLPGVALAETTQEKLDAAQLSYEEAQAELDRISAEYEQIATQLSDTTAQIVDVSDQIDEKQEQIDEKQEILGQRMSSSYKAGPTSTLDLLLSSATFDELTSNIYYLDKITEADSEMIAEVRELKEQLEQEQAELEAQKADLEELQAQQQAQLEDARAKQQESQELVDGLSAEVQELMEQRDAELLAAQQLAEQMRQQQQQQQGGGSRPSGGGGNTVVTGSGSLSAVISACHSTPSPGSGLCAAWVTNVFQNAGVGSFWGNADDMYYSWCGTSPSNIQPGMIIAVNSSPASAAGRIYGHIGIYVGNGTVMDNVGYVRSTSLSYWTSYYSALAVPLCGWLGGIKLS
ncbi:coiled-coil domain-containing protein [Thermophilibacter sp.]|uniref:coiled-coil domain-containing protein n=1 Tax=Thermophilibacter sp. TaxID=2847309 RepID=UPI003A8E9A22